MGSRILGLNIGIGFLVVGIISTAMSFYNSASNSIINATETLSTQEVKAFNDTFTTYEGSQEGSNIRALITRLISNANTYQDEPEKIPGVRADKETANGREVEAEVPQDSEISEYVNSLIEIRTNIDTKHEYWVTITKQENGFIDAIIITYDAEAEGEDADLTLMH